MNKDYMGRRYFIVGFRNYIENRNKILAKTYIPSIRELLYDYIDIYNDIRNNIENDKWLKALNDTLKSIEYFLSNTILSSSSIYKKELKYLIEQINNNKKGNKNLSKIYNACTSFIKKINNHNIYSEIIEVIKKNSSYSKIDNALQLFTRELIYDGYSLFYLKHWYRNNINIADITNENIENELNKFIEIKKDKKNFYYYINVLKMGSKEEIFLTNKFKAEKVEYDDLTFDNNNEYIKYLDNSKNHNLYKMQVYAMDVFKGLEILVSSIISYYQIINFIENNNQIIVLNKVIGEITTNDYIKMRIDSEDDLFKGIEEREKADLQDFLKYRNRIIYQNINIQLNEVDVLQRALNIVKGQSEQSAENKIINLWSALEYILTFHEGKSIIGKVCDVVPKLVSLYIIKDKINIFWSNLHRFKAQSEYILEILDKCTRDGAGYEYDLTKFIQYLLEKGKNIISLLDFNDILVKEISEIGSLLYNEENRFNFIAETNNEIENDIIRLYRTRNVLIHSAQKQKMNLNYKALRLYQYNNSLLGVIIYYKNKNININITEILNSINYTYFDYLEILKDKNASPIDICKPRYIYL